MARSPFAFYARLARVGCALALIGAGLFLAHGLLQAMVEQMLSACLLLVTLPLLGCKALSRLQFNVLGTLAAVGVALLFLVQAQRHLVVPASEHWTSHLGLALALYAVGWFLPLAVQVGLEEVL